MATLTERLLKASKTKMTALMPDSKIFEGLLTTPTRMLGLNLALSGDIEGGLEGGLGVVAGPSKHFKSGLSLEMVAAYLKTYKDAVCLFYDSEFGSALAYFKAAGIDPTRVIHTPIMNIEELKFDIMSQLNELKRGDHVIIYIDSIGNLASIKETQDALKGESKADMTRAKQLKSLSRMITPHLTIKDIPCIAINHTYKAQDGTNRDVVGGGTGFYYSANWIFVMGREQVKKGTELAGYQFNLKVEKSRQVREGSKIPIGVDFETGIDIYGGLLDLAVEFGFVEKPKVGWYTRPCVKDDKNWRAGESSCGAFWDPVFKNTEFSTALTRKYRLSPGESNPDKITEELKAIEE